MMPHFNTKSIMHGASVIALFASLQVASIAMAQDGGETASSTEMSDANRVLGTVTVTAQKREESVNDIGMAISAFQGEDLEILGLDDTTDLPALVPGLTFSKQSSGAPVYTLRGVGFNTNTISNTSPVGVYFDEVSFPFSIMSKGLTFDIERVEVLKGPQGTLYGRNTTGGLINYIANKPIDEFEAYVEGSYGSFETLGVEGVVNLPIADTFAVRVGVKHEQSSEGWQKSVSRDETLGEVDKTGFKLSAAWEPSETFSSLFTFNYWTDKSDSQAGQAINFNPEDPAFVFPGVEEAAVIVNPDNRDADWVAPGQPFDWPGTTAGIRPEGLTLDQELISLAARFDWDINPNNTITSITSYTDFSRDDWYDRDATPFELVVFNDNGEIESFSQEIRLTGETDRLKYIGGLFYSRDESSDRSNPWAADTSILNGFRAALGLHPNRPLPDGTPAEVLELAGGFRNWQNYADTETTSAAIFGQLEYALTDSLDVTVGLRYTEDEIDFIGCSRDLNGQQNIHLIWGIFFNTAADLRPGECQTNGSVVISADSPTGLQGSTIGPGFEQNLKEDNLSGRFALDWDINDTTLGYFSYSRGYKSGAFPNISANVVDQYLPATQERLDAFEVGIKASPSSELQINAALYHYLYEDKQIFGQVEDLVFSTLTRLVNVPESEVTGAELDVTWFPTDRVVANVTAAYLDTEIIEYEGFNKFGVFTDFAGSEFEYSPEWQINGLLSYGFDISQNLEGRATVDVAYTSAQNGDLEGTDIFGVDSYTLAGVNLAVSPKDAQWEAGIQVRNLFDEYYWNSVLTQTDTTFRYAGLPRTITASIRFNF